MRLLAREQATDGQRQYAASLKSSCGDGETGYADLCRDPQLHSGSVCKE